VQPGFTLAELNGNQFLANLGACAAVYAAAMNPPVEQLPGRHTIMERHAGYAAFRAIAAIAPAAGGGPADRKPADRGGAIGGAAGGGPAAGQPAGGWTAAGQPADDGPATGQPVGGWTAAPPAVTRRTADGPAAPLIVGFAYGFHGGGGQWWHDLVSRAVASVLGGRASDDWFGDSLEIAEVHVHPSYQGRGTGLAMMLRLTAGRPEPVAVLSTMDSDTKARRLYRGLGFTDLLTSFTFPGTEMPYAIMGAPLPLAGAAPRPARPDRPSRW
jgi:ribosomal protein S18 acetylase RimI-like enzyme